MMSKKFTGKLLERIDPSQIDYAEFWGDKALIRQEKKRLREEYQTKLDLLSEHYGIVPNGRHYQRLALELAKQFVPGFNFKEPKGAPQRWTPPLKSALVLDMDSIISPEDKSKGLHYAARTVVKRPKWSALFSGLESPADAALNIYKKHKKSGSHNRLWGRVFSDAGRLMPEYHEKFIQNILDKAKKER